YQGQHGFAAVDDPVVIGQCKIVHGTDHDLTVLDDRALLGGVDAQNGRLRRIDDRGGQHGAEHTAVRDRERTAGEFFQSQLAVTGAIAEVGDRLLDLGDRHLVGVAQDGHHQTTRAADSDTDVEVAVV